MFAKSLTHYRALSRPVRSLIFLHWLYGFGGSLAGAFIHILLYIRFESVAFNVFSAMVGFTGIAVGFCVCGYFISVWRANIKRGFILSFLVIGASIVLLLMSSAPWVSLFFVFLNGVGNGLYWLTIHTFELTETKNEERDYYSSLLSAGGQVVSFAGPATATVLIWVSQNILHAGSFALLFFATPLVYLAGFLFFVDIRDYRPAPILWSDVLHFFKDSYNRRAQGYFLGQGFEHIFGSTIIPLSMLFILGSALNVGFYNTIIAIGSALCLLAVSRVRTTENRLFILGITTIIMVPLTLFFGYMLTFETLLIFTLVGTIVWPLRGVSIHVIDLQTMESAGRAGRDFYATMILRDVSLWIGRLVGGAVFLILASSISTEKDTISYGIYFFVGAVVLVYFGAAQLLKKNQQ